ncbi:MAG TPA: hypothetical protein VNW71_04985 [Thermoanaerobaculia bacterium]|nr:hypothetical protein [Thermoanaerobaculia bacterium]
MASIKTVGNSGQISLGKQYAGRQVFVEELEPGVWMIKAGQFIADNELWLHEPGVKSKIEESLEWMRQNPPRETDLDELEERLQGERKRQGSSRSQ